MKNLTIDNIFMTLLIMSFFFTLVIAVLFVRIENIQARYEKDIVVRDSILSKYMYRDSLILDHLNNCSYIHKDEVGVGYQGYLYSKYHRKYKIEE
jgi:hypothetical protein